MARPLAASLIVILCALLLERILRLIDLVAAQGGPLGPVLQMALNLIPHYLGLALPAAFFISMFVVVARLADDAELEAMMAVGRSLRRIEVPFVLIAVVLALVSLAIYGFLQPYTRYAYRAIFNMVKEAGWTGDVPQGIFVNAGDGMTIFAEAVDSTGRRMIKVFIHERHTAAETMTTAERGELVLRPERDLLSLILYNGRQVRLHDKAVSLLDFDQFSFTRDFSQQALLFRPRGADERELTLVELYEKVRDAGEIAPDTFRAELHGRIVRALSILVLPFFAVPMGLAAKRGRRAPGLVIASVILVLYHHSLQFGEGLVDLGRADPIPALWGPFAVFSAFCLAVTWRTDVKPGIGPLDGALSALETVSEALAKALPMRWRSP
jgi:lipopolysaccharide export system permease protein